jgi:hypothetical protein
MTVDVRCTVATDQGISASGSLSEDHIDVTNKLATVRGTIEFLGIKNLARGTAVNVAYTVPGYSEVTRFPRRLRILSSKVDPFAEITTAQVGCLLALKSDLRPPDTIAASANEPAWVAALPANMSDVLPVPVFAADVLAYCLDKLGITAASGNVALTSAFLREELDLSAGYVQTINDLIASEACYGFINAAEQFVVRKVLATGATGPVLTRDQLITMEGIDGGAPPADSIRVTWSGAVEAPPGLVLADVPVVPELPASPGGTLNLTTEQQAGITGLVDGIRADYNLSASIATGVLNQTIIASGATPVSGVVSLSGAQYSYVVNNTAANARTYADQRDRAERDSDDSDGNRSLRDWTYEQTISPVRTFVQEYVTEAGVGGVDVVAFAATSTNVTTFADVVYTDNEGNEKTESVAVQRSSQTTDRVGPANPTRWKSKLENGSPARPADELVRGSVTTYFNIPTADGIRVKSEETVEYEPRIGFAGGLGIQNWVGIDLGLSSVPVSRTVTSYEWDEVADTTKVTVSRWLAWGKTTEGANGAAAVAKALENWSGTSLDGQRIDGIYALVNYCSELVFDGSEVRITAGRGTAQKRGSKQDRARDALGRDPLTGRRRSTGGRGVGLRFGSGSPTASSLYTLPFPADDTLEGEEVDGQTLRARIAPGNVQEQARVYGQIQNALAFGHANGVAITTEIRNLPTEPLGAMFVEAAGVSGVFRANGSSWAWGPEGMIVGTDALLVGTAGTYAAPEFEDSWIPVPVAISSLPTLGAVTTNSNPKPANTITTPGGFDPVAPGSLWASLPTNGTDVPAVERTVGALVEPRNERVEMIARSRSGARLTVYDYALDLGTTELRVVSVSKVSLPAIVTLPLTTITVTALAPTIEGSATVILPLTTISVTALAPVVESPGSVILPLTTLAVTTLAPVVEQAGAVVVLPLTTISVTALAPTVAEVGTTTDPNFSSVSLLLPMNGTNGSTTFTDVSNNAFTVTPAGNAQISTAQSKWGGSSARFDGDGDFLSIAYASALDLLGSDFTVEGWVRIAATPNSGGMRIAAAGGGSVAFNSTNGIHWLLQAMNDNTIQTQIRTGSVGGFNSSNTWTLNTWSHVALCVSGSTAYLGLNGTVTSSTITGISRPSGNPVTTIGTINGQAGNSFSALNGNTNDFRIIKEFALYTGATYTVPAAPFPTS